MLRTLECSGFKSFAKFRLDFKPGLNILVGPNGSGKTNIILFLEFLGILTRSSVIEAIGRVGGAGSIFRRRLDGKYPT
jgi:predicted ATPase